MAWMGMPVPLDQMPGLATDEQMKQLRDASGAESDKLFLELMAAHHRGGVHMAEHVYRHATNDSDTAIWRSAWRTSRPPKSTSSATPRNATTSR